MTRTTAVLGLVVTALVAAGCRSVEPADTREPAAAVAVTVVPAAATDLAELLEAGGTVAPGETAMIAARVLAAVGTVRVGAGDRVRAGDVLVTLDARDLDAQVRGARASAQAAEGALVRARSQQAAAAADHTLAIASQARIRALRTRESATPQELDEADARLAAAGAHLAAAEAAVHQAAAGVAAAGAAADAASITESFTVISAPFAGVIAERFVDPGTMATPGAPLLRLEALGPRRVDVRVDEGRVGYVRPGDRVEVIIGADEAGSIVDGTVTEVARASATDERTFTVKVALPPSVMPRSGTFARVRFRGASRPGLVLPLSALRRQGQVTSVFVVEDGVARIRLVQVGASGPDGVDVVSGLEAGEPVIDSPPPGLTDGQRVAGAAGRGAQ